MTTRAAKQFRNTVTQNLSFWISKGTRNDLLTMEGITRNPEVFLISKHSSADWLADTFYVYHVYRQQISFHSYLNALDSEARNTNVSIWKEVKRKAKEYGRLPILLMGQLKRVTFVCLNAESRAALTAGISLPIATFWEIDLHLFHFGDITLIPYKKIRSLYGEDYRED